MEKEWFALLKRIRFDGPNPGWTNLTKYVSTGGETFETSGLVISDTRHSIGQTGEGKERWRPGQTKNIFTIGKQDFVFFFITFYDLKLDQNYTRHWKFYSPDGRLHWTSSKKEWVNQNKTFNLYYTLYLSRLSIGKWRVEFEIDDRVIKQATFEIL